MNFTDFIYPLKKLKLLPQSYINTASTNWSISVSYIKKCTFVCIKFPYLLTCKEDYRFSFWILSTSATIRRKVIVLHKKQTDCFVQGCSYKMCLRCWKESPATLRVFSFFCLFVCLFYKISKQIIDLLIIHNFISSLFLSVSLQLLGSGVSLPCHRFYTPMHMNGNQT